MFTAKIENQFGELLTFTQNESVYQVISIDGLNPAPALINTTAIAGLDGARFNSSRLEMRNIVIYVKINGDVETNRLNLYRHCITKTKARFYFQNDTLDVWIDGYIERVECSLFEQMEIASISIICPYPYFSSVEKFKTLSTNIVSMFEFPFSIEEDAPEVISEIMTDNFSSILNSTDSRCGMQIVVDVLSDVDKIEVVNTTTAEDIKLDASSAGGFLEGDRIVIVTEQGRKDVYQIRAGTRSSLFPVLVHGSKFPQLQPGLNILQYSADDVVGSTKIMLTYGYNLTYRGV